MKYLLICITCLSIFFSACKQEESEPQVDSNPFLKESGTRALVIAHRGGRDLYPENTLVAFDSAVIMAVDVLEMDVCLTKDGILVTIHDLTIDRTSDTTGNVIDYTFQELQAFNFGYKFQPSSGVFPYRNNPVRIPRLEDVFMRFPNQYMEIEIKDAGENGKLAAEKLLVLIRSYNMTRKVVAFSFADDVMDHFHAHNSDDVFTGASLSEGFNFVTAVSANPDTVLTIRADVFAFPQNILGIDLTSDAIIRAAHRHKAAIHYWTIDDKDDMKSLIQKRTDGIITDRPDIMREALKELGF